MLWTCIYDANYILYVLKKIDLFEHIFKSLIRLETTVAESFHNCREIRATTPPNCDWPHEGPPRKRSRLIGCLARRWRDAHVAFSRRARGGRYEAPPSRGGDNNPCGITLNNTANLNVPWK